MTKPRRDTLLAKIEEEVLTLLRKPANELTPAERLKAIEVGAKVLMIRHKIEDGGGAEGSFFAKGRK